MRENKLEKNEKKLNTRITDQTNKQKTKTDQNSVKNDIIVKSTILNGVCVCVCVRALRYILQLEGKSICVYLESL